MNRLFKRPLGYKMNERGPTPRFIFLVAVWDGRVSQEFYKDAS